MKAPKIYHVQHTDKWGRDRIVSGTLEELIEYHSYTLEIGNSWNPKINRYPKTIRSFISNYNKSVDEKYDGYHRPYLHLVPKGESVEKV